VPRPSWPEELAPQQEAAPALVSPQVWKRSAARALKLKPPETGTGIESLVVEPVPNWPKALLPQQYAAAALVSPQVWEPPAARALKLKPPETATGVELLVPKELVPQQ
jgi:hypothetical protein